MPHLNLLYEQRVEIIFALTSNNWCQKVNSPSDTFKLSVYSIIQISFLAQSEMYSICYSFTKKGICPSHGFLTIFSSSSLTVSLVHTSVNRQESHFTWSNKMSSKWSVIEEAACYFKRSHWSIWATTSFGRSLCLERSFNCPLFSRIWVEMSACVSSLTWSSTLVHVFLFRKLILHTCGSLERNWAQVLLLTNLFNCHLCSYKFFTVVLRAI